MRNLSVLPWPKYLWKKDKIKIVHLIIFSTFFLVGINSYDDYGVSIDEYFHYTNGQHYYSFFKGLFFESNNYISADELRESWQFHHFKDPAIFDFIIAFIVDLFQLKNL